MQDQILQVDENMLETRLDRLVSEKVEQLLNAEADEITGAARYERTGDRKAYRVGHYERDLTVKAGTVTLKVPKLKGALFESAVIELYFVKSVFRVGAGAVLLDSSLIPSPPIMPQDRARVDDP